MTVIRYVWFWGDPEGSTMYGDEDRHSFINLKMHYMAAQIFPVYSAVVAAQQLENPLTEFQFVGHGREEFRGRRVAHVLVFPGSRGDSFEHAKIIVPAGPVEISYPKAGLLALEAIHAGMRALSSVRGWPEDRLAKAQAMSRELVGARHAMRPEATSGFRVTAEVVDPSASFSWDEPMLASKRSL